MTAAANIIAAKIEPRAVMIRAWTIFRSTYRYPAVPFASIGRQCFAWSLKEAWRQLKTEAAEAARLAATPADVRTAHIARLTVALERLPMIDCWPEVVAGRAAIETELRRLAA